MLGGDYLVPKKKKEENQRTELRVPVGVRPKVRELRGYPGEFQGHIFQMSLIRSSSYKKKQSMMQSVFSCHNMILIRIIHFFNGLIVSNTLRGLCTGIYISVQIRSKST